MAKVDTTLTDAKTAGEALTFMFIGFKFFVIAHPKKTGIAFLTFMLLVLLAFQQLDLGSYAKIQIEEAIGRRVDPSIEPSLFVPVLQTQKTNRIIIGTPKGPMDFGAYDPNFTVYVMRGEWKVFVYNHATDKAHFVPAPWLKEPNAYKK